LDVELSVDGRKIALNEFVTKIFSGIIVGAVSSLSGIDEGWKKIELKITR